MHRAWPLLLLVIGAVGSAAAQSEPAPGRRMSDRLAREIRSTLPSYDAALDRTVSRERLNTAPSDPGVITMPEVIVQDRRIAIRKMEERAREAEQFSRLKRRYLAAMSGIGTALNSFTIPLVSAGGLDGLAAEEAQREMMRIRFEGFQAVADTVATTDADAGDSLKREIHTLKHGTHPAGWPPIRP